MDEDGWIDVIGIIGIILVCVFCLCRHSEEEEYDVEAGIHRRGDPSPRQGSNRGGKTRTTVRLGGNVHGFASVSPEETREASSLAELTQGSQPRFTRLVEEAPEAPTPPPRGRREVVGAEAAEAEEAEEAEKEEARGAIEAVEARVEAFRSSSIEGKEVVEYRVQARTLL